MLHYLAGAPLLPMPMTRYVAWYDWYGKLPPYLYTINAHAQKLVCRLITLYENKISLCVL